MPLRLIGTIILLLVVTIFAGANLDNRCDINFIFTKVQQVPVFLTAIVSFLIGAIIMIPFTFKRKCNNDKKSQNPATTKVQKSSDEEEQKTLFDFKIKRDVSKNQGKEKKEKKSWFEKNKKSEETKTSAESKASTAKDSEKSEKSETPKSSESEKSSSNQNSGTEKTKETTSV